MSSQIQLPAKVQSYIEIVNWDRKITVWEKSGSNKKIFYFLE